MRVDGSLRGEIALVADEQLVDIFRRILVDLLQPLLHVGERSHFGDIVNDDDAVCAAIIRRRDGSETLLSGSVPLK